MDQDLSNLSLESVELKTEISEMDSLPLPASPVIVYEFENEPLQQQFDILQHKAENLVTENSGLKEVAEINKEKLFLQAETISTLQCDNEKLSDENARFKEDITKLQAENAQLKETNEECQAGSIRLNDTVASLQTSLETAGKEKAEVQEQIAQLIKSHAADETSLQNENTRLRNTITALQASLKTAASDKAELVETYEAKEEELQAEITHLNDTIATLQTTIETSIKSSSQLQNDKSELLEKVAQTNNEINKLNVKVCEQAEKIRKFENDTRKMQNQISELSDELSQLVNPYKICKYSEVVVNGKIDYERCREKILVVKEVRDSTVSNCIIDDKVQIPKEQRNFKICSLKLSLRFDLSLVFDCVLFIFVKRLHLRRQTIQYTEFKKLISSCKNVEFIIFDYITVKNANGAVIEAEQIWRHAMESPYLKSFEYTFKKGEVTSETGQKLAELPTSPNLEKLSLENLPNEFCIKEFSKFIKKNPRCHYCLYYNVPPKDFAKLKSIKEELHPTLPSTCKLTLDTRFVSSFLKYLL